MVAWRGEWGLGLGEGWGGARAAGGGEDGLIFLKNFLILVDSATVVKLLEFFGFVLFLVLVLSGQPGIFLVFSAFRSGHLEFFLIFGACGFENN